MRRLLARSERWSADRMRAWQAERLSDLLVHAHATSPFCRRRLDDAGLDPAAVRDPSALRALPVLTKDDLRRHGPALRSRAWRRFAPRRVATSGSTGTALQVLPDRPTNALELATL